MKKNPTNVPRTEKAGPSSEIQTWLHSLSEDDRSEMEQTWHLAGLARGTRPEAEALDAANARLWAAIDERDAVRSPQHARLPQRHATRARLHRVALGAAIVVLVGAGVWLGSSWRGGGAADESGDFMLLLRSGDSDRRSLEEQEAIVEALAAWADTLRRAQRLRAGEELAREGRVLAKEGEQVIDQSFSIPPDGVNGFFIITARDYEDALDLARECPYLDYGGTVELRPIIKHKQRILSVGFSHTPQTWFDIQTGM